MAFGDDPTVCGDPGACVNNNGARQFCALHFSPRVHALPSSQTVPSDRISKRRVQFAWATWQRRAGFDRVHGFHCLRHSAISSVYAMTHDLYLAQRFARHVSPLTTTAYTHPSDEEMAGRVRSLPC